MKKSLVIALALMLVLAFATSAMAAQALVDGSYLSTTAVGGGVYTNSADDINKAGFTRTMQANKFSGDGKANYPYEIYLPNELDPANYRIHTNYTKNTDACASCHATHTAVGESLLQWYSVYETCMACHDGTLGNSTYNVEEGVIGATGPAAFGGMFGTGAEKSLSNHNVTGSMDIAAAPGGSTTAVNTKYGKALDWEIEFGCASCHTPHGQGGNARILHPDPNYAAQARAKAAGFSTTGLQAKQTVPGNDVYYVSPGGLTVDSAAYAVYDNYYFLTSYPYALYVEIAGTKYGTEAQPATGIYEVSNVDGYTTVTITDAATKLLANDNTVKLIGVPTMKVRMEIQGYLTYTEKVQHVSGMNAYCGACHTDYNTAIAATYSTNNASYRYGEFTGSGSEMTGVFTQAHRHQVGFQWHGPVDGLKFESGQKGKSADASIISQVYGMECLTCHVAHGTSQDYWATTLQGIQAADGTTWPLEAYSAQYEELAGSSALKRMPNMGTCEACHAKGEGAQGYNAMNGFGTPTGATNTVPADLQLMPNTYNYLAYRQDYAANDLGWVGNEECLGCHKEYVDGWKATSHSTSSHTGVGGCGQCHNPGNSLMAPVGITNYQATPALARAYVVSNPFATATSNGATYLGVDAGITCESCHGSGARHVQAPSSRNIFNPGTKSIERQAIECGRCHDMYYNVSQAFAGGNDNHDLLGLGAVSGTAAFQTVAGQNGVYKTSAMENTAGWSVGYRVYNNSPAQFATASQLTAVSTHFGGAWGYADSKHFIGTGSAENPNGVVTCNTCHDMHSDKNEGLLKYEYEQICTSCHDASANLAKGIAMPMNAWNRHQIETRDFSHAFKFTAPTAIADANVFPVNLEQGAYGYTDKSTSLKAGEASSSASWATKVATLFPGSGRSGAVGVRIAVYSDAITKANQVYNNYGGTFTLTTKPNKAIEGEDYTFVAESGAVEFVNSAQTKGGGSRILGTWTVKWVSDAKSTVDGKPLTMSSTFTITP